MLNNRRNPQSMGLDQLIQQGQEPDLMSQVGQDQMQDQMPPYNMQDQFDQSRIMGQTETGNYRPTDFEGADNQTVGRIFTPGQGWKRLPRG